MTPQAGRQSQMEVQTRRQARKRAPTARSGLTAAIIGGLRGPRGMCGAVLTALVFGIAAIGPFVTPYNPTQSISIPFATASGKFLLGTDVLGRDVLSRLLDGGWYILALALIGTVVGVGAGALLGVSAAYARNWLDGTIMRVVDVLLAFPGLVLALLLVSLAGGSFILLAIAISLSHAPQVARVIRSASLELVERDFVKAVELCKVGWWRVIRRELLPNLSAPLSVEFGLRFAYSVIFVSGLSYLGFGQAPPAPDWGVMISENQTGFSANWWSVLGPCALIAVLTVGVSLFTDAMARSALGMDVTQVVVKGGAKATDGQAMAVASEGQAG